MPRDKDTGARKGFAFLMYEDQRSTVLAVDNLNGSKVLEKTLRVDHVKNYKQPKVKNEDGEMVDAEEQSLNAKPQLIDGEHSSISFCRTYLKLSTDGADSDSSASTGASIDPEDPMRDYLIAQRKEEKKASKKAKKSKGKEKHKDETPEERRARKAKKKEKKEKKAAAKSTAMKGVEDLLNSLGKVPPPDPREERSRRRSRSPSRERRSRSPYRGHSRHSPYADERYPPRRSRYSDEEDRSYGQHSRRRSSRD